MTRARTLALAAILVLALVAGPGLAAEGDETDDSEDSDLVDIGADHDLDTTDAVREFNDRGHVSTDLTRLDMSVTVAEKKGEVALGDQLMPSNVRNDYLRIQYNEEAERTVRILIPEDYWTPYLREEVESITTDHTASYKPARNGAYTSVVIEFDGPADVVLPVQWDASLAYKAVERVDNRLNNSLGVTFRGDNSQWEYVNSSALTSGPGYEVGEIDGSVTVQFDATPDQPEETWVNAPEGETMRQDIYYYTRESENATTYIVSKTDDVPTVRYKTETTVLDRMRGNINDISLIPDRISEAMNGGDILG